MNRSITYANQLVDEAYWYDEWDDLHYTRPSHFKLEQVFEGTKQRVIGNLEWWKFEDGSRLFVSDTLCKEVWYE